jgi:hypothetical protein
MTTGFEGFKLAIGGFIVPFIFVYHPALILQGPWEETIWIFLLGCACIILTSAALEGWLFGPASWIERILMLLERKNSGCLFEEGLENKPSPGLRYADHSRGNERGIPSASDGGDRRPASQAGPSAGLRRQKLLEALTASGQYLVSMPYNRMPLNLASSSITNV